MPFSFLSSCSSLDRGRGGLQWAAEIPDGYFLGLAHPVMVEQRVRISLVSLIVLIASEPTSLGLLFEDLDQIAPSQRYPAVYCDPFMVRTSAHPLWSISMRI